MYVHLFISPFRTREGKGHATDKINNKVFDLWYRDAGSWKLTLCSVNQLWTHKRFGKWHRSVIESWNIQKQKEITDSKYLSLQSLPGFYPYLVTARATLSVLFFQVTKPWPYSGEGVIQTINKNASLKVRQANVMFQLPVRTGLYSQLGSLSSTYL